MKILLGSYVLFSVEELGAAALLRGHPGAWRGRPCISGMNVAPAKQGCPEAPRRRLITVPLGWLQAAVAERDGGTELRGDGARHRAQASAGGAAAGRGAAACGVRRTLEHALLLQGGGRKKDAKGYCPPCGRRAWWLLRTGAQGPC